MATIAMMIGAAVVNAVAFTAGNALYDKFGRDNGAEERLRHDKAVEEQQKAVADWNKKRAETLDWINSKLREKSDARRVFDDVDRALDFYNETHPDGQIHLEEKPSLNYTPSDEQNYHEIVFAIIGGTITGFITHKLF